jgi:hypothetical protein
MGGPAITARRRVPFPPWKLLKRRGALRSCGSPPTGSSDKLLPPRFLTGPCRAGAKRKRGSLTRQPDIQHIGALRPSFGPKPRLRNDPWSMIHVNWPHHPGRRLAPIGNRCRVRCRIDASKLTPWSLIFTFDGVLVLFFPLPLRSTSSVTYPCH